MDGKKNKGGGDPESYKMVSSRGDMQWIQRATERTRKKVWHPKKRYGYTLLNSVD